MAISKGAAKRNIKRKVQRMTVAELRKFIGVTQPEIRRLSSMVAHAQYELRRRGESEYSTDVMGETDTD